MTWKTIEHWIEWAKAEVPSPDLLARQINSSGHPDPYYNFLRKIAEEADEAGVFLELGCYYGCLAAHLSASATLLTHVGVDINPVPFSSYGSVMIQGDTVGTSNGGLPTVEMVKRIAAACGGIQYVFQDSSHHYDASVKEWELYSPLVKKGGLWIADDITPAFKRPDEPKGMVEYFEELPGDKRLFSDLHVGSVIGVIKI